MNIIWAALLAIAQPVPADSIEIPFALEILVEEPARSRMAQEWDEVNPQQVERAYCVMDYRVMYFGKRPKSVVIYAVEPAIVKKDSSGAYMQTPVSIVIDCGRRPTIHIHTPTTCEDTSNWSSCKLGGRQAYFCFPSIVDERALYASRASFGVVQCDQNAFVGYSPLRN